MATSLDEKAYLIGAADVYYRAVGVLTPWTNVGVTLDDAILRVMTEWFTPDNLAGVMGPVQGLDVLTKCTAEIEFTLPEVAGEKFGLAIPGAVITAPVTGVTAGGLSTTTTAAAVAGATSLALTAVTNAAVGDAIHIDTSTASEYRTITAIAALVVSFRDPLLFAHASGVAVVETDDDNRTVITAPIVKRQPASAYREWALVAQSGKSNTHELRLPRAISTTTGAEITMGDAILSGIRVTLAGRYDPANLQTSPFKLYAPAS